MLRPAWPLALLLALLMPLAAPAEQQVQRLHFAKGSSSATVDGQLKGDKFVDYQVRAAAGQTLSVSLKASNPQNYFNVLPPGSGNVAMHVAQDGQPYKGLLPDDGDYVVRVYLMRAAARRGESSRYTLTVAVDGKALPSLPASQDARLPGTRFHASAMVPCKLPYVQPKLQRCEAFVIRHGVDGTATVELRSKDYRRRVLFEKGVPVASDSAQPMTSSRSGDITRVGFDEDESADIPDALLTGG